VQYPDKYLMTVLRSGLYVVATPIGNLGDLSHRAKETLAAATIVAAEDTRISGKLLKLAGSTARMVSLTEHNVLQRAPGLVAAATEGLVALVSDAGTPGVSDPGARLVEAMHAAHVPVFAVPGPSALAAAVSVSGFDGSDVHFIGFPPRQRSARIARFKGAAASAQTIVFFESPGRLAASLRDLAEGLGDPEAVVCRELTKLHEEVVRGRASELAERFEGTLGECAIVVRSPAPARPPAANSEVVAYMEEMKRAGAQRARAAAEASGRFGVLRSEAYARWPSD
jgi:16S rRNA (cytidine1402-2'-O)-methyltransferase